jgi:hypothetical protein
MIVKGFRLLFVLLLVAIVTFVSMVFNAPILVFFAEIVAVLVLDIWIIATAFKRNPNRKKDKSRHEQRVDRARSSASRPRRQTK